MIRKATIKDIPRIAEVIVFGKRVAYRTIFQNDKVSFNELQVVDIANTYYKEPSLLEHMLVYDDGIVKGVINQKMTENAVEICEFYVEPFFKGRGIGRALIQYAIKEATMEKKRRIFLWVLEENLPARKFYEANGFAPTGESCLVEGTTQKDLCYELRLGEI